MESLGNQQTWGKDEGKVREGGGIFYKIVDKVLSVRVVKGRTNLLH